MRIGRPHLILLTLGLLLASAASASAVPCNQITTKLTGLPITEAHAFPEQAYKAPDGQVMLPASCRVKAVLRPTGGSAIRVEVWMPLDAQWNGKYLGTGNGGLGGLIITQALKEGLRRNYAVANTDMGTAIPENTDAAEAASGVFLIGQPQKWDDFGWRSTHEMTSAAKKIIKAYYGKPPQYSYFMGCSTGGQQGLVEAQKYPTDYDGIIAGAPGYNRTHLHASFIWAYQHNPNFMSLAQAASLNAAVIASCGAQNGGQGDGFLNDPRTCGFEPDALLCGQSPEPANCLASEQVSAIKQLYDGLRDKPNGYRIYPGWHRGSELNWVPLLGAEPALLGPFKWALGKDWNWKKVNYHVDMTKVDQKLATVLNASQVDLSLFRDHGGKIILYHGWADGVVPAQDTINYYERVAAKAGGFAKTQEFARLFLAPGMHHCLTGPGPNVFNGAGNYGGVRDARHDVLSALDAWVTSSGTRSPEKIIASKYVELPNDADGNPVLGPLIMTRPLCPYPKRAQYAGPGAISEASSFKCIDGWHHVGQVPAQKY